MADNTKTVNVLVEHLANVKTIKQGRAIVEDTVDGYMIMMPDGTIQTSITKADAARRIARWFKKDLERLVKTTRTSAGLVGVGSTEWRTKGGLTD